MPPVSAAPQSNGLIDSHESRLQRLEVSVNDLSVQVGKMDTKQDFYHELQKQQSEQILEKIEDLARAEEKHERHIERIEDNKEGFRWLEMLPVKFIRKHAISIVAALVGVIGHKGWQLLWELLK